MRKANIELLRVIAMLMVLTLHYLGAGQVFELAEVGTANYYLTRMLEGFCIVAVNCYVLISGYFLCESRFRLSKLIRLWSVVLFYSVSIYLIALAAGKVEFDIKTFIFSVSPVFSRTWSFVTDYLGVYMMMPFLNLAIRNMSQKQHLKLLLCCIGMFSLIPSVIVWTDTYGVNGGYSFIWFVCLYLTAAYLRKHYKGGHTKLSRGGVFFSLNSHWPAFCRDPETDRKRQRMGNARV